MIRKIVMIDEEKCIGCGACADACHEGAIAMVNGKARLIKDDYCDGLGDCLPACPTDAISIIEREAAAYDEAAVKARQAAKNAPMPCGCPGTMAKAIKREACAVSAEERPGRLSQWPVQIKLLPVNAPYFDGSDLLIAADCTAFAYASFHEKFIDGRITMVGCPKLDNVDYSEKLAAVISQNDIKTVTVTRMEVPCCGGIEDAVHRAIEASGKAVPCKVYIISAEGKIIAER